MITPEKLERQQREREAMRQAIATYTGPITKCPPGRSTNVLPRRRVQGEQKKTPTGYSPERLAHQLIVQCRMCVDPNREHSLARLS